MSSLPQRIHHLLSRGFTPPSFSWVSDLVFSQDKVEFGTLYFDVDYVESYVKDCARGRVVAVEGGRTVEGGRIEGEGEGDGGDS